MAAAPGDQVILAPVPDLAPHLHGMEQTNSSFLHRHPAKDMANQVAAHAPWSTDVEKHNEGHCHNSTKAPCKETKTVGEFGNSNPFHFIFTAMITSNSESTAIHSVFRNLRGHHNVPT